MSYVLVCFHHSSDSIQQAYLNLIAESINNLDSRLQVEIQNELDSRWAKYSTNSNRFPEFILFRDNARKANLSGKHDLQTLNNWLTFNLA